MDRFVWPHLESLQTSLHLYMLSQFELCIVMVLFLTLLLIARAVCLSALLLWDAFCCFFLDRQQREEPPAYPPRAHARDCFDITVLQSRERFPVAAFIKPVFIVC